jgi:hypothetical protein
MHIPRLTASLIVSLALVITSAAEEMSRGGRVGWARLVTGSSSWSVHQANDPLLASSIRRETSLNIDSQCYPTNPAQLAELCRYPFIFTNNLTNVRDPQHLTNLREYLRRGGFIYIDRCVNLSYSLPQEPFYERHLDLFARFLPGSEIRELPESHEIFRCYFSLNLSEMPDRRHKQAGHNGVYGVFDGGRMVALLSLANFQCGWPQSGDRGATKMKMIANIYVYAMTHGTELASKP